MATREAPFDAPVQALRRDPRHTAAVLADWLGTRIPGTDLRITGISAPAGTGVANETLLLDASWRARSGDVVDGGFAVRVAVDDPLYVGADISVACEMYRALGDEPGVPVPAVYGYEPDPRVLGAPFFAMERLRGAVPADQPHYTEAGFVADATPLEQRRLWEEAVEVMCRFHQIDPARLAFLQHPERGTTGLEQDLTYWRDYYRWAARGRAHPTLDVVDEWLVSNLPDDLPTSPAWGDARVCNMVFQDFRCVGMLDWDGVSLAGPESDLAWWCVMEHAGGARTPLPGLGSYDELVQLWQERTGCQARNLRFHVAYALFRLGGILLKLDDQMHERGLLPPEADIATNSDVVQQLVVLLDVPPAGPVTATLPPMSAL